MSTVTSKSTSSVKSSKPPASAAKPAAKTAAKPAANKAAGSTPNAAAKPADNVKLSKDAGAQPNQGAVPNFQSWASPSAAGKTAEAKPMSGDMLARKDKGGRVKDLQDRLNAQGAKLDVDGKFGPLTQKAVKKFQRQNNLTVDGKVGPETMGAFNKGLKPETPKPTKDAKPVEPSKDAKPVEPTKDAKPVEPTKDVKPVEPTKDAKPVEPTKDAKPVEPTKDAKPVEPTKDAKPVEPTKDAKPVEPTKEVKPAKGLPQLADKKMSTQEKYDHYAAMVEAAGGKVDSKKPTVLGLRGLGPDGQRHDSGKNTGSGDDTFVVLGHDKKGQPTVSELRGATHAAVKQGSVAGGVAQLQPGNYEATRRGDYKGHDAWAINGSGNVPVYRDGNRDGVISEKEKAQAVANNTKGDGILFHFDRGVSIGCQTLPVNELEKLNKAVGGGNFRYTLLDANRPQ